MIIDSYAWIEYFYGTNKGIAVRNQIEKGECYTLECNLAEIYEWALRQEEDFSFIHKLIASKSEIMPINRKDWLRAVELKIKMRKKKSRFGLADAIMLAKQEELRCRIITGDEHFKGEKDIIFLA